MVMENVQVRSEYALQRLPQLRKALPAAVACLSVTEVPEAYVWLQLPGQLMRPSVVVVVPEPPPVGLMVSVKPGSNVAVTVLAALMVTVQSFLPLQPPPDQP